MKKSKALIFIILLFAITGIAAFVHLNSREDIPENGLKVVIDEKECILDVEKLSYETVTGTYVTGKGETRSVEAPGILLKDILKEAGITEYERIIVTADDSYSVEVGDEEAYLIRDEESLRLIVFGDKDSKRNVKNVVKLEVN